MSFLARFAAKKEEGNSNNHPPVSTEESSNKQDTTQNAGKGPAFGDFVQFKRKPSGSVSKMKGFDPFNMGSNTGNNATSSQNLSSEQNEEKNAQSGHGSLTRLDEGETPKASGSLSDVSKKSAFGFIQNKPIKVQRNEVNPTQSLSFVTNVNTVKLEHHTENTEHEQGHEGHHSSSNINERRTSMSSNASETINTSTTTKTSFGFIRKKQPDAEQQQNQLNQPITSMKKQTSLQLDGQEQESGLASSDTKSDAAEGKNVSTPPSKFPGSNFLKLNGKSPLEVYKQSEAESTLETRSEYQGDREKGSDQGAKKTSGPSFLKFKQKGDLVDTPNKSDTLSVNDQTPSNRNASPTMSYKDGEKSIKRNYSEPEHSAEKEPRRLKVERVSSPLLSVQTPIIQDQETPENVLKRLESQRNELMENIGDLVARQNGLMDKKSALEVQRENNSKKLKMVAHQQNEAIERDNFEEADHLEVVIVELNDTMRELEKQIDDCQLEYAELEKEKQMLYQNQSLLYKNYIAEIENLILAQNYNFEKYKLDCQSQQITEKAYIEEKTKELQYIRNHIELDLKHINEETNQVNETLNKQIKDYVVDQESLSSRKATLEETIERIRRELKAHEDELADVSKNLNKVNTKINTIKGRFDDQLTRIKKKRDKVTGEEEQYQVELQKLNQHKEKAEYNLKRLDEVTKNYEEMLKTYNKLKGDFAESSTALDQENAKRERAIKLYYDSLNDVRQQKSHLLSCEEEIDKLKDDLNRFQKEISNILSQKAALANKIPDLEKEKKGFVASRSFKDASRVSNEIKDIQTKISELEEKSNQLSESEKVTIQKISTLEKDTIPSLRERVNANTQNCDLNKYELLKVKECDLRKIHDYYSKQRLFEEANMIDTELRTTQKQLIELLSQYPELREKEAALAPKKETQQNKEQEKEKESMNGKHDHTVHEEHKEEVHHDIVIENKAEHEHEEVLIQDHHHEPENTHTEEQPKKEMPLSEMISLYEELTTQINNMEAEIDQLASEDKFAEADEVTERQNELRKKQEEIVKDLNTLGYNTIDDAKAANVQSGEDNTHAEAEKVEESENKVENQEEVQVQETEVVQVQETEVVHPEEPEEAENQENLAE